MTASILVSFRVKLSWACTDVLLVEALHAVQLRLISMPLCTIVASPEDKCAKTRILTTELSLMCCVSTR